MAYEVTVEHVEARQLAAVKAAATPDTLADVIFACLDKVWPVLRDQEVKTDHNVVVYRNQLRAIDVGVEVLEPFEPRGEVVAANTPAGEVATTTHWGHYSGMSKAYEALEAWSAANDRALVEAAWEVYGDWDDDPSKLRTDVFFRLAPS